MAIEIESIAGIASPEPGVGATLRPPEQSASPKSAPPRATAPEPAVVDQPEDVGLVFEVGRGAGDFVIKVVDRQSHKVIREIPPEEVQRMRSSIQAMVGLMLDRTG